MINVAVIGGGASGIGAAWGLSRAACKVTIFEGEQHLGGAGSFAEVPLSNGHSISIDLGFNAFNRAVFTNLAVLFDELGLKSRPANQDVSLMRADGALIWYTESGQIHFVERPDDEPRVPRVRCGSERGVVDQLRHHRNCDGGVCRAKRC